MSRVTLRSRLSTLLLLAGSGVLVWCLLVWAGTTMFERWEARHWSVPPHAASTPAVAAPVAPPAPKPHAVIGWLSIPRLRISTAVLEGDDSTSLRLGAGHIPGTPLPGAAKGNVGIAAHRDTFFRALRNVKPDDRITVRTAQGDRDYQVESIRIVKPSNVSVLDGAPDRSELTLVTCYPFYYVGSAPMRFIVRSKEVAPVTAALPPQTPGS